MAKHVWQLQKSQRVNTSDAKKYLQMLGQELQKQQITGEILVADDVVMLLDIGKPAMPDIDAYLAGKSEIPKDINAYFGRHSTAIHQTITAIADRENLSYHWLNDTLKEIFYTQLSHQKWIEYPGLRVYTSPTDYVLAMKVATASCPQDIEDIKILIKKLQLSNLQDLCALITKYISEQLLTPEMRLIVEQAFASQLAMYQGQNT